VQSLKETRGASRLKSHGYNGVISILIFLGMKNGKWGGAITDNSQDFVLLLQKAHAE
jgi:hypothetical protein